MLVRPPYTHHHVREGVPICGMWERKLAKCGDQHGALDRLLTARTQSGQQKANALPGRPGMWHSSSQLNASVSVGRCAGVTDGGMAAHAASNPELEALVLVNTEIATSSSM